MALHINLYHEVEKQKAIDRRDPLKLAIIGLSVIAACFAGYYIYELTVQSGLKGELSRVQTEFTTLQPKADAAKAREDELNMTVNMSQQLVKRIEGRFYWAPVLDLLIGAVPREVQITKVAGDVSGGSLKRCLITVEGIAAGVEPRTVAEDLRKDFEKRFAGAYKNVSSTFKALEDGKQNATLEGRSLPTAAFTINVQLQTGEEPTAATAAPAADAADLDVKKS